jgi:uncharacterized protein DUF6220
MRTRSLARAGLAIVSAIFAALLVVQVFLAGLGVFGTGGFGMHRDFGYLLSLFILLELLLAVVGRAGKAIIGLVLITLVQIILQSVFVAVRVEQPAIAALHPVNGVLMLFLTIVISWRAWRLRNDPLPVPVVEPEVAPADAAG